MPILSVRHLTRYRYRKPVAFGEHRMMFRPREGFDQRIVRATLAIVPEPARLRYVTDVFGNTVGLATFASAADELRFESRVDLDHRPVALSADGDHFDDASVAVYPLTYSVEDMPDLLRSIEREHLDPDRLLERWARRFVVPGQTALSLLSAMTRAIHAEFGYMARLEVGTQTPAETLALGSGSCRDLAVLMIEAARSLNLAARFVSGYIYSTAATNGAAARVGGGHTHAWVRVYLPRYGWAEFDPTNGIVGSTDLIRVAVARDPRQALPLSGTWQGDRADALGMDVEVDVTVHPEPDAMKRAA